MLSTASRRVPRSIVVTRRSSSTSSRSTSLTTIAQGNSLGTLNSLNTRSSSAAVGSRRGPAFRASSTRGLSSAAAKRDYYEVLGVKKDATTAEMKKKYFQLAKENHPDQNKNNPAALKKFQEAAEAWEVLGDEKKRAQYDQFGHVDPNMGGGGGFGQGRGSAQEQQAAAEAFQRVFQEMFGGGGNRRGQGHDPFFNMQGGNPFGQQQSSSGPQPGEDVQARVRAPFDFVLKGGKRRLEFRTQATCTKCSGSGSSTKKVDKERCKTCQGRGFVNDLVGGFIHMQRACTDCGGEGSKLKSPCTDCRGEGRVSKATHVEVEIPPGIATGHTIRVAGAGPAGRRGGPAGNLFVEIEVEPHPQFIREGADVKSEAVVGVVKTILGGQMTVRGVDEDSEIELKVPAGVRHGESVRMRGKGLPKLGQRTRGDHYVTFMVEMPKDLTPEQTKLLQEFEKLERIKRGQSPDDDSDPLPTGKKDGKGLFTKIKDAFS